MPEREEQQVTSLDLPDSQEDAKEYTYQVNPRLKSEFMDFHDEDFLYWT